MAIGVDIPKFTVIQYIRDKNRTPYGVLVAVKNGDGYLIGHSLCNKKDRFSKNRKERFDRQFAVELAIGRAIMGVEDAPHAVRKAIPAFVERCNRYYKKKKEAL